jgi:SWI/SNF-related matrix-associated actin-dependent regulator 1 of chromatin subfamily A
MESRNSGFLCLDQGLGKTACAILYINRQRNTRNIIIVPPVAIYVWLGEFQKWAPGEDVTAVTTTAQLKKVIDGFTGNLILSYDVFKANRQAVIQSGEWGCVICDESHYLKERSAQRTKAVWSLLAHVSSCFFLTGTPVPNRHIELWAPLRMLNIIKMDYTTYGLKFCGAWCMPNGYWNYGGSTNAPELKSILAPVMFRCTKDEVLKELPPRQLIVVSLDMPIHRQEKNFDKKELDKYDGEIVLPKLQELLIEQAHKKLPKVIAFVRDLLTNEPKVVIFAEHRAIIEALVAEFKDMKAVLVYGGITPKGRAAAIDIFQSDPECRVFIGQSIAAGVATTLTAASAVVFAESPWSWGTVTQCIDRTHRIGQKGFVKAYFMTVAKSIDEYVIKRLIEKHEVVERVVCPTGIEEVEEERNLM